MLNILWINNGYARDLEVQSSDTPLYVIFRVFSGTFIRMSQQSIAATACAKPDIFSNFWMILLVSYVFGILI